MAVICHADSGYLTRSANLPPYNSYTMAGWFARTGTNGSGFETALWIRTFDGIDPWSYILNIESGVIQVYPSGAPTTWSTSPGTSGDWWYLALTGDGVNTKGYWYTWNGSSATLVETVKSAAPSYYASTDISVLCPAINDQTRWWSGKCAYVRVWDVALTQSEIEAELPSSVIVKTANINTALGACNTSSFANDVSGNGRNWTRGAGLSTSDFDSDVPSGLTGGGGAGIVPFNLRQGGGFLDMGSLRG